MKCYHLIKRGKELRRCTQHDASPLLNVVQMRAAFDREATGQWEQILQMQERCDALSQSRNDDWMRFTPRTDAKWEASHGKLIKGMRERKKDWWERDEKTPRNNYASKVSRLNELA